MYIARFALCPYSVDIQVCFALQLTWYYAHYCRDLNFTSHLLDCVMPLLFHPHTSTALFHSITTGLELMVITFALMVKDRTSIASTAASRYPPGMNKPSTLVCASWGRHLPYSGLFLREKLFTIFVICQQLTIIFSHKNPSEHADTLNRYDLFSASYHIVPGKRPWALAAQVSKIEGGWLHGGGA